MGKGGTQRVRKEYSCSGAGAGHRILEIFLPVIIFADAFEVNIVHAHVLYPPSLYPHSLLMLQGNAPIPS